MTPCSERENEKVGERGEGGEEEEKEE